MADNKSKPEKNENDQGDQPNKPGKPGTPPPKQSKGMFGFFAIMLMVLMLVMYLSSSDKSSEIKFDQFVVYYESGQIEEGSIVVRESGITAKLKQPEVDNQSGIIRVPISMITREEIARQLFELTNGDFKDKPPSGWVNFLFAFGPLILIIALLWFFIGRSMKAAGGGGGMIGSFGKSRHKTMTKEMTGITFKDVAGIEEAKAEVTEIIEFLKNPKKFTRLGGRIPRGVLLSGQPGCGKTLLAKAIAGEADVPFFSISGSDFVEMFVGVGASRVRDLFKQAKEASPCIIFLDEIDAIGRRRGGGFSGGGGNDEREQTLNAILVEMDGFGSGDGVIVVAATNRPDVLDPALIRPGRFDRQIQVPLPDVAGRLEILSVHAKKVKLGPNVDMEKIARGTPMFSGADLSAIINEAAISATMLDKEFIEHEDLEEARDKVKFGRSNKSRVREKEENKLVAYHEAGHAVLQAMLKDADPLHKVTIIPRGNSGGATFSLPEKDRMGYGLKWLHATMRVICGGRIAEAKAMDDVSSGASSDIRQVTSLARAMILEWGMSAKLGFINYAGEDTRETFLPDKDYSDDTARVIDEETRRIVDESYKEAETMLMENWDKVESVAQALLKYETLDADEVHKLMRGESLQRSTVADLLGSGPPAPTPDPKPESEPTPDAEPDMPTDTLPDPA